MRPEHDVSNWLLGLQHGTVTAVLDHVNYEITTLRIDQQTDGPINGTFIVIHETNSIRHKIDSCSSVYGMMRRLLLLSSSTRQFTTFHAPRHNPPNAGRHAVVTYTSDWSVDAARRDLTVNAMSVDMHGHLHDYYNGQEHLAART